MIPKTLITAISQSLSEKCGRTISIEETRALGGGCIHNAAELKSGNDIFFVKWNTVDALDNFLAEAHGLTVLADAGALRVPTVLGVDRTEQHAFLLLEFISSGTAAYRFWQDFGERLATLHRHSNDRFGLDRSNFIGSLPQSNTFHDEWNEFFVVERLEKQLRLASDSGLINSALRAQFARLFPKLEKYIPAERPALLHGDLWSGNFMRDSAGQPVVIDPAVYYGHREIELAFTKLFGGFAQSFYSSYEAVFPLESRWHERVDLFNLYPLLVHVNIFGESYLGSIRSILRRFV